MFIRTPRADDADHFNVLVFKTDGMGNDNE
jgi:hypothetical protein